MSTPVDSYTQPEPNKGREEVRKVTVYNDVEGIDAAWVGLRSIIQVERSRSYKGKKSQEVAYYISSLSPDIGAEKFFEGIRGHWRIESFHYIKDVTFKEDNSKVRKNNAPSNISVIRNIAINIFQRHKETSIAKSIRMMAHSVGKLMKLILE